LDVGLSASEGGAWIAARMRANTDFVEAAPLCNIAPGAAIAVVIAETAVALFNADGKIFAVDDSCIRCGSSLAAGSLEGTKVTCSGCEWRYDIRSGCLCGLPALQIDTFEVKIVDSRVMIGKTLPWASHGNR